MPRPLTATLDLDAMRHNFNVIRQVAAHSRIWSVVKANAYGHGIERIWSALGETDGFATINLEEAILLRNRGWKGPVLMLEGFFHADELALYDQYSLTPVLHSHWQINALAHAQLKSPLDVYLKINSGMNRLGFCADWLASLWQQLRGLVSVRHITLMSHFANADKSEGVYRALDKIEQAAKGFICPRSLANSAATLWHPETHFDWVRTGIALYGASPSGQWCDIANSGLRPVMTLESEIIGIQHLRKGDCVGYGSRYRASHGQRIGIVAGGYADGYPRHAPDGTPVMVEGKLTRLLGTVSMDMLAVDLTSCPESGVGSKVELWGKNIKIDEVASAAGTVGYELMCALAPRVPVVINI